MDEQLEQAQGLLAAGDVPGLILQLRAAGERLPLSGMARLLAGAARLAVWPLALALERVPDSIPALSEFVSTLEHDGQHARVLTVLEEHEAVMVWKRRFYYVYNALM